MKNIPAKTRKRPVDGYEKDRKPPLSNYMRKQIVKLGRLAKMDGRTARDNPFTLSSESFSAWTEGFNSI